MSAAGAARPPTARRFRGVAHARIATLIAVIAVNEVS